MPSSTTCSQPPTAIVFRTGRSARQAHAALRSAVEAMDHAEHCALLWFAEMMRRKLYRELGYSSINQYAAVELGFSRTRTGDFIRLAGKLDELPRVRASVARGEMGYTKAREIVKVATRRTEKAWVAEAATSSRRDLERKVKTARQRARAARVANPEQGELVSVSTSAAMATPPAEIPVRLGLEFTPEQFARYEAMLEKLKKVDAKAGGRGRAELVLAGLAALVEATETEGVEDRGAPRGGIRRDNQGAPRGDISGDEQGAPRGDIPRPTAKALPGFQIYIHECPECRRAAVQTTRGELSVGRADLARAHCDARLQRPGESNRATIPPAVRRAVLARDRHRCQSPGCGNARFLEVHHRVPRRLGGSNTASNLVTLCGPCHRLMHARGDRLGPDLGIPGSSAT